MDVQHSPPESNTRSQDRPQAVLASRPIIPHVGTQAAPPLRADLHREPIMEAEAPSMKEGKGQEDQINFWEFLEEENSVGELGSDGTEVVLVPVGVSEGTGGPNLALSNQPGSNLSYPAMLAILQKMTQIMANI
ncbi:hypothetical protein O181_014665 [Austropuccinia psidii MF-1]|uniref:Uncharacterized protein n=1 Tax=Austropuccinia psidii MF-1 TaxID=1389203 RepID=A0A9Q3C1D9_9BASI|nr:hypothetical protein [Austropuccinia psidii MF-1]